MTRPRVLVAVLAALAFSLVYLRTSEQSGRLAQDLGYDDISYVLDATQRLQAGFDGGVRPFLRTFSQAPPHSPFSTAVAVVALTVFGLEDSSVYLANALILVLAALFLVHFFREERGWLVASFVLVYLTSPFAYRSVTDFRPDLALGTVTAAFALLFVRGALEEREGDVLLAGTLFGVALLVKPSFFVHTLALALVLGAGWAVLRLAGRRVIAPRTVAVALAIGAAIAAPYYVVQAREVFHYFWSNTRGAEAHLWSFPADTGWLTLLHRYTIDRSYPAFGMMGRHLFLGLGLSAAGILALAARQRFAALAVPAALLGIAAVSLFIVVVGRHNNEFFTATFQALVLFTGFVSAASALRDAPATARAAAGLAVAILAAIAIRGNSGKHDFYVEPEVARGASWNSALVEALRVHGAHRGDAVLRGATVFVTATGPVSSVALEWTARKLGMRASFRDLHRSDSIDEILREAQASQYVVVPNPARAATYRFLPAAAFQDRVLAAFRADPRFETVPTAPRGEPDHYFLFARTNDPAGRDPQATGP